MLYVNDLSWVFFVVVGVLLCGCLLGYCVVTWFFVHVHLDYFGSRLPEFGFVVSFAAECFVCVVC